jgi:hypothetical protein
LSDAVLFVEGTRVYIWQLVTVLSSSSFICGGYQRIHLTTSNSFICGGYQIIHVPSTNKTVTSCQMYALVPSTNKTVTSCQMYTLVPSTHKTKDRVNVITSTIFNLINFFFFYLYSDGFSTREFRGLWWWLLMSRGQSCPLSFGHCVVFFLITPLVSSNSPYSLVCVPLRDYDYIRQRDCIIYLYNICFLDR